MKTATIYSFKITRLGSENLEISSWPFELALDFKSLHANDPKFSLKIINQESFDIPWINPNDNRDRGTIELYKFEISEEDTKAIIFNYTSQQWCPYRKQVIFNQCLITPDYITTTDFLYDTFAHEKSVITSNNAYKFDFTLELDQWKFLKWVTKYYNQVSYIHDKQWQHALGTLETYAEDKMYDKIIKEEPKIKPFDGKKIVNFNDLDNYGLIWKINKEILHPLGLALDKNEDGTSKGCRVASSGLWEYSEEANNENLEKYDNFLNLLK